METQAHDHAGSGGCLYDGSAATHELPEEERAALAEAGTPRARVPQHRFRS